MCIPMWLARLIATVGEGVYRHLNYFSDRPLLTHFLLRLVGQHQDWPIQRAKEDFGWEPMIPTMDTVKEQVEWLNKHRELWN